MTQTFVIDEGVLHLARSGTNERGERDLNAVAFLSTVLANHHRIGVTKEILRRYNRKLKAWEVGKTIEGMNVNKALTSLLISEERQARITTAGKHLPKEIPADDADFVLAAYARPGSILVTQDRALLESVERSSLKSRGVTALSIREGLKAASGEDP